MRPPIGAWLLDETDVPTSLADSFAAARMRPATALSAVGNGLQFLVADTAQLSNGTAPSVTKKKLKKNTGKKKRKKHKRSEP